MTLDLCMPDMLMLVSMTLTLGRQRPKKNQRCMLTATKQAINIKLATTVGHFYETLTLTLQTFIWLDQLVFLCKLILRFLYVVVVAVVRLFLLFFSIGFNEASWAESLNKIFEF